MNNYREAKNTIACLFKRCAGCGDDIEEGAFFYTGIPLCLQCHTGDILRLHHINNPSEEEVPMSTTIETVTTEQCEALAREANAAGDDLGASIAWSAFRALESDDRAHHHVRSAVAMIRDAEAMVLLHR